MVGGAFDPNSTYSRSVPGCPRRAENADEMALDTRFWTSAVMQDPLRFFNENPLFADMTQAVMNELTRCQRTGVFQKNGNTYTFNPACPRCKAPQYHRFIITLCSRIQLRFLACWDDPVRSAQLRNDVTTFVLRYYKDTLRSRSVVYNAYMRTGTTRKCHIYTPPPVAVVPETPNAAGSTFMVRK